MSPRVGVTLSGRYRLQRLIATGGMGQVWEGVDSRLGRRVAIKVLKAEYSTDSEFVERFRAEARTVAMLNHPGIAGVYDYGETDIDGEGRTAYLVMELVNGEPLNSVLKRTGRLSLRHALDMLEQTGRALQVSTLESRARAICPACEEKAEGGFISFVGDLRLAYACPSCEQVVWLPGA